MPYKLDGNCVVKDDGTEVPGGCHPTHEEAVAHLAALQANVPDAQPKESAQPDEPRKTRTTYLREGAMFEAVQDGAQYVVPVTLITPGWSKNGRHYGPDVLSKAAKVFEGVKAYADHPGKEDEKNRPERSVKDIVGYYTGVNVTNDGALKADLHVVGEARQWLWPLIQETVTAKQDLIGLSINALGKTSMGERDGKRGVIVEDIVKGNSTDIVTTPAAGGAFERLQASDDGFTADLLAAMDYDEWRTARPEFVERLAVRFKTARLDESVRQASAQVEGLTAQVSERDARIATLEEAKRALEAQLSDMRAEMARRDKAAYADQLIAESKLPSGSWHANTRAALLRESETGQWPSIVANQRQMYADAARSAPVQPPVRGVPVKPSYTNALTEALGVSVLPLPNETPEQYALRKAQLMNGER